MIFKTRQDLINQLNKEDTTEYLKIINHINDNKLESWDVRTYFGTLTTGMVGKLSTAQITMLRSMVYKRGNTVNIYQGYGNTNVIPIKARFDKASDNYIFSIWSDVGDLAKDDLKYLTTYHITQWKKDNPTVTSKRNVRGIKFQPSMDMFSLEVFRNSITSAYLRTEAKNLILQVNSAFDKSPKEALHIRIRNKFYALILDNTPVQTKALLNAIRVTKLWETSNNVKTFYQLEADECVALETYYVSSMVSYMTPSFMNSYSSDLNIVTHSSGIGEHRDAERRLSAASILLTAYAETGNEAYKTLATRMLTGTSKEHASLALVKTKAVQELRNIIEPLGIEDTELAS